jgi:lysophospholipase L1-like esterase
MDFSRVLPEMNQKPVIYLAGDSTAQSYGKESRPQTGWGEMLMELLDLKDVIKTSHRKSSPFDQEKRYENRKFIVDNCAMAGRSSRSFREEGRLDDIISQIQAGDYLLIQFGHNDAARDKPKRYVPVEEFADSIGKYIECARKKQAFPVLLSPIALRPCTRNQVGDRKKLEDLLQQYTYEMKKLAKKEEIPYIDMYTLTLTACRNQRPQETAKWYNQDNVHLVTDGARKYAGILAREMKERLPVSLHDVRLGAQL